MLTEYRSKCYRFYVDGLDRRQGEAKWWAYGLPFLSEHCFYKDSKFHGESKNWRGTGQLYKRIQSVGWEHTMVNEIRALVEDTENITHKERMLIKLKFGIDQDLCNHNFYQNNKDITEEIKELVEDIEHITDEERMMIKLKFGIECIGEEIK